MCNNHYYCVVMAGGLGTRFWPVSRASHPKQFLTFSQSGKSFLRLAWERLSGVVPEENRLVVSLERYRRDVLADIPELPAGNLLLEPYNRNTACCIAYAAYSLLKRDPDAVMVVLPSDQVIDDAGMYRDVVCAAMDYASSHDDLITLGIVPTRPDPNFGYIQVDGALADDGYVRSGGIMQSDGSVQPGGVVQSDGSVQPGGVMQSDGSVQPGGVMLGSASGTDRDGRVSADECPVDGSVTCGQPLRVKTFTEKPSRELAQIFIDSGEFLWNAGIFVWKARDIIAALAEHAPEITALWTGWETKLGTPEEKAFVERIYPDLPRTSIDYAVMEKAENVITYPATFGWADIGNWQSFYEYLRGRSDEGDNAVSVRGRTRLKDTSNTIVYSSSKDRLVAVKGLDDFVVIDSGDVLLICPRDEENLDSFLSELSLPGYEDYR